MKRLLRLENRTDWSSIDLRRFLSAGIRRLRCGRRTVKIRYGRGRALTGWAYIGDPILQLTLPGPKWLRKRRKSLPAADLLELAQTFEHEIDHTKGKEHKDMPKWTSLRPKWHKGLPIRFVPEPILGVRAVKQKLKKAEERLEKARRARNKWKKRIRQLERKE